MTPLYIIVGMLVPAVLVLMVLYHHKSFKMTSTANSRVVSAHERVVRDEKERREETVVVTRFVVNGRDYELEQTFRGRQADRFPPGRELPVRYNPAEPNMAKLVV